MGHTVPFGDNRGHFGPEIDAPDEARDLPELADTPVQPLCDVFTVEEIAAAAGVPLGAVQDLVDRGAVRTIHGSRGTGHGHYHDTHHQAYRHLFFRACIGWLVSPGIGIVLLVD
jgi:hypothetical protein